MPEYSCVFTCIQYRIRTWKTCVFTHVEHFRCNYSIYKEHAKVLYIYIIFMCKLYTYIYIYIYWHIGVWQDCHTSGPIVSRYKPAKDSIETFITTRCPESEFLRTMMGCSTLCWSRLVLTYIIAKFAHLNLFCGNISKSKHLWNHQFLVDALQMSISS